MTFEHYFSWGDESKRSEAEANAVESFRHYGYVVFEDIFTPQEVEQLKTAYDEIANNRSRSGLAPYDPHLMPHTWDDQWLEIARHKPLVSAIEFLLGGKISLLHSQITFKPPKDKGFSLHQDNYYNCANPGDGIIAVWIAIDDADEENGTLIVYPQSHKEGVYPHLKDWLYFIRKAPGLVIQNTMQKLNIGKRGYEQLSCVIERFVSTEVPERFKPEPIKIRAGSVGFMHGDLIHSSGENHSVDRFRRNLLLNYIRRNTSFKAGIMSKRQAIEID